MSAGSVASVATGPMTARIVAVAAVVAATVVVVTVAVGVTALGAIAAAVPLLVAIPDVAVAALVMAKNMTMDVHVSCAKVAASCATRRVTSSVIAQRLAVDVAIVVIVVTLAAVVIVDTTTGARPRAAAPHSTAAEVVTTWVDADLLPRGVTTPARPSSAATTQGHRSTKAAGTGVQAIASPAATD